MCRRLVLVAFLCLPLLAAGARTAAVPVTLVAIPWGMASLDGGDRFIVPSTMVLEPGEYRLTVERQGYLTVERTLRVENSGPQHHMIRLQRR
jgi:hypothetical protein